MVIENANIPHVSNWVEDLFIKAKMGMFTRKKDYM